jgi:hypothetical protein
VSNGGRAAASVGSLAALLLLPVSAPAQEADYSKVEIKVTPVSGNVYLLQGAPAGR